MTSDIQISSDVPKLLQVTSDRLSLVFFSSDRSWNVAVFR